MEKVPPEGPRVDRLLVTRQFALSYEGMRPFAARQVDIALARFLSPPENRQATLRPLLLPAGYHELRAGHRDRVVLRIEGSTAVLIDVLDFSVIARLNARAARNLQSKCQR